MRVRAARAVGLLGAAVLVAAGCGGGQAETGAGACDDCAAGARELALRARHVAAAWDGSSAAAAWRRGYHPMGEVVELPRGGLRTRADRRALRSGSLVLRTELPATAAQDADVTWTGGRALTRPLEGAAESYRSLAGGEGGAGHRLTVTGAKLGEMRVVTSRGPATVPAWLFRIAGYDTPLKRAAVTPSKLPRPPIGGLGGVAGGVESLVRVSADGRTVTVVVLRTSCHTGPGVAARETRGSVVLIGSVTERKERKDRKDRGFCAKRAGRERTTVRLERPVGDRVLLDAHEGRPLRYTSQLVPSPGWS